jgi:hypothetical protein
MEATITALAAVLPASHEEAEDGDGAHRNSPGVLTENSLPLSNRSSEARARFCDGCGTRLTTAPKPASAFTGAVRASIERDRRASGARLAMKETTTCDEALEQARWASNASTRAHRS